MVNRIKRLLHRTEWLWNPWNYKMLTWGSEVLWIPTSALPVNFPWTDSCSQQLGKNPLNSSFVWFKVAEIGLSSFLGHLGSMPCAEVLSRTWQSLSPPQHCLFGITLGNKLRSYTSFALQQKKKEKGSQISFWIITQQRFIIKNLYATLCSVLSLNQPHYIMTLVLTHEVKCKKRKWSWLIVTRAKIWLNRAAATAPQTGVPRTAVKIWNPPLTALKFQFLQVISGGILNYTQLIPVNQFPDLKLFQV